MGKSRGRPKKGELADMTIPPDPEPEYHLPPPEECEEYEGGEILSINHELRTCMSLWLGRYMVKFSVMQYYRPGGSWEQVARIDTCHKMVHRHQLQRGSSDNHGVVVQDYAAIPANGGWEVVDNWYGESLTLMHRLWQDNLRQGGWRNA